MVNGAITVLHQIWRNINSSISYIYGSHMLSMVFGVVFMLI